MSRDRVFDEIEASNAAPMISVKWSAYDGEPWSGHHVAGLVDWWRKMPDLIKRRRARLSMDDPMRYACDTALAFVKYYMGECNDPRRYRGYEVWSHNVLSHFADWQEHRTGQIANEYAQDVMRDAMHELERTERRGL